MDRTKEESKKCRMMQMKLKRIEIIFLRRPTLFAICNNTFSKWWESEIERMRPASYYKDMPRQFIFIWSTNSVLS
jgi:hypothetical protein